ncbi:group III truncated hemoglobin [Marinoscillum sp.]|uniref:group III truncated hemoglobin n=1 Tax=Marinoscillum sp. TaxID=2024838 RepID=UPI003BA894FF
MKDIQSLDDIKLLVDTFYAKVRVDDKLGPIFIQVIKDQWPAHLEKMYRFWQSILLGEPTYNGRPFPPHVVLPIGMAHFNRWIQLFHATLDEHFEGPVADEARDRSVKIAQVFMAKLDSIRSSY